MKGYIVAKNGKLYAVVSFEDRNGKKKQKWFGTGLDEKANKRKAEEFLKNKLFELTRDEAKIYNIDNDTLFADYFDSWLESVKPNLQITTYGGYLQQAKFITKWFKDRKIKLNDIRPIDIRNFYSDMQNVYGKSVQVCEHYHVNIRKCLQSAVKAELISSNPADKVDRPRSPKHIAKYYNLEQLEEFFKVLEHERYAYIYLMTAYYGLRRSEMIGLKWGAIDFDKNKIVINHAVAETRLNGKRLIISKDIMKNKTSNRTYPLLPNIKQLLLKEKELQEQNKDWFKKSYNKNEQGYICVNDYGVILKPQYLSSHLEVILKLNNLQKIKFHELRHSYASLLLSQCVGIKEIQEWLVHSTFNTTADIYSHLDFSSKMNVAQTLNQVTQKVKDDEKETVKKEQQKNLKHNSISQKQDFQSTKNANYKVLLETDTAPKPNKSQEEYDNEEQKQTDEINNKEQKQTNEIDGEIAELEKKLAEKRAKRKQIDEEM